MHILTILRTVNVPILPTCIGCTGPHVSMPHTTSSRNCRSTLWIHLFLLYFVCDVHVHVWMFIVCGHMHICGWRPEVDFEFLPSLISFWYTETGFFAWSKKIPLKHLLTFWLVFRFHMQPNSHCTVIAVVLEHSTGSLTLAKWPSVNLVFAVFLVSRGTLSVTYSIYICIRTLFGVCTTVKLHNSIVLRMYPRF